MDKLGLTNSPEKVTYIFVGEAEGDEGPSAWYTWNHDSGSAIPISEDALRGKLTGLVVSTKEYKGKQNYKLNIHIDADHHYVIRAGANTVFSRGVLLALQKLAQDDVNMVTEQPITIAVKQGEGKAIFGSVFDATNQKVMAKWDGEVQLLPIVNTLQAKLGQVVQTKELIEDPDAYYAATQEHKAKLGSLKASPPAKRKIKNG